MEWWMLTASILALGGAAALVYFVRKFRVEKMIDNLPLMFDNLGLVTYLKDGRTYGTYAPKAITFKHPKYIIKTPYNSLNYSYRDVQDSYMGMDNMLNVDLNKEVAKLLKTIEANSKSFARKNNLDDVELSKLVPLLMIFGFKPDMVAAALSAGIEPAVLAAVVKASGGNLSSVMEQLNSIKDTPVEWLARIYDFEFEEISSENKS